MSTDATKEWRGNRPLDLGHEPEDKEGSFPDADIRLVGDGLQTIDHLLRNPGLMFDCHRGVRYEVQGKRRIDIRHSSACFRWNSRFALLCPKISCNDTIQDKPSNLRCSLWDIPRELMGNTHPAASSTFTPSTRANGEVAVRELLT